MFISFCFSFAWLIVISNADQGKVFGGRRALKGEFPSTVVILDVDAICAGLLVALDKVFTTANCFFTEEGYVQTDKFIVYGGTLLAPIPPYYLKSTEIQERKILSFKVHEKHSIKKDGSSYHDIALILLVEPFVERETLSVAKFLTRDEKKFFEAWKAMASSKKSCIGVGWGTTVFVNKSMPGGLSDELKAIKLTPVDPKICSRKHVKKGDEDMFEKGEACVSSNSKKGESICLGDAGSPIYCDGYAFGMATSVVNCGNKSQEQFFLLFGPYFDYFNVVMGDAPHLPYNLFLLFIVSSMLILRNGILWSY